MGSRGSELPFTLDAIDRQIVALLLEDGRTTAAEITRRIGHVSERAVRYRIERLMRWGVIRVSAVVNPQAVGFPIMADVLIEVAPGQLQNVAAQVVEFENVSYVAGSVGEGDLSIQVYARDTAGAAAPGRRGDRQGPGSHAHQDGDGPLEAQGRVPVACSRAGCGERRLMVGWAMCGSVNRGTGPWLPAGVRPPRS